MILGWSVITFVPPTYGNVNYPSWGLDLGWCMVAFVLIWIPAVAVLKLMKAKGNPWKVGFNQIFVFCCIFQRKSLLCKKKRSDHVLLFRILYSVWNRSARLLKTGIPTWTFIEGSATQRSAAAVRRKVKNIWRLMWSPARGSDASVYLFTCLGFSHFRTFSVMNGCRKCCSRWMRVQFKPNRDISLTNQVELIKKMSQVHKLIFFFKWEKY